MTIFERRSCIPRGARYHKIIIRTPKSLTDDRPKRWFVEGGGGRITVNEVTHPNIVQRKVDAHNAAHSSNGDVVNTNNALPPKLRSAESDHRNGS